MSTTLKSPRALSLDAVQQAFDHWRSSRTQRGLTPVHLRKQALSLMAHHKRSHICKALHINDQALSQWAEQSDDTDHDSALTRQRHDCSAHERFVELPALTVHGPQLMDATAMTALRIELPNGSIISTDSVFAVEQILHTLTLSSER